MKKCICCNIQTKNLGSFLPREDRVGYYAFCNDCMIEQVRKPDWPAMFKRGGGVLKWNLDG